MYIHISLFTYYLAGNIERGHFCLPNFLQHQLNSQRPFMLHVWCVVDSHDSAQPPFPWMLTFGLPCAFRLSHSSTEHNLMSMHPYRLNKPFSSSASDASCRVPSVVLYSTSQCTANILTDECKFAKLQTPQHCYALLINQHWLLTALFIKVCFTCLSVACTNARSSTYNEAACTYF